MDGHTLEHLREIPLAHEGGVLDLALNEDGTLLASAGIDGVVRIWDVAARAVLHEIPVSKGDGGAAGPRRGPSLGLRDERVLRHPRRGIDRPTGRC